MSHGCFTRVGRLGVVFGILVAAGGCAGDERDSESVAAQSEVSCDAPPPPEDHGCRDFDATTNAFLMDETTWALHRPEFERDPDFPIRFESLDARLTMGSVDTRNQPTFDLRYFYPEGYLARRPRKPLALLCRFFMVVAQCVRSMRPDASTLHVTTERSFSKEFKRTISYRPEESHEPAPVWRTPTYVELPINPFVCYSYAGDGREPYRYAVE